MKTYTGWQDIPTLQSKEIISELMECKDHCRAAMIISETGLGKTNAIRLFKLAKPKHTYVITVGDTYTLTSMLQELMEKLGLVVYGGKNSKYICLRDISKKLNELGQQGETPLIIIDEAENSKINMLKACKQLYDAVIQNCSIVLIGTNQLITVMNKKSESQSIPQLRRRFKAGTRYISPINKARDFKPFFDLYIPGELDLQDLLMYCCDNYGELHDYLDPVLRYAAGKNESITEKLFRFFHKLPKQTQEPKMKRV